MAEPKYNRHDKPWRYDHEALVGDCRYLEPQVVQSYNNRIRKCGERIAKLELSYQKLFNRWVETSDIASLEQATHLLEQMCDIQQQQFDIMEEAQTKNTEKRIAYLMKLFPESCEHHWD